MQDRPTAGELLKVMREFCERELQEALTGRLRFQVRILQNLLAILEREWEGEEQALNAEWDRLTTLIGSEPKPDGQQALAERVKQMNLELSKRIRSGEMDDRFDETLDAVYETVKEKLAIANPRWASSPPLDGGVS